MISFPRTCGGEANLQLLGLSVTADKAEEEHLGGNCKARGASCDSTLEEMVLLVVNTNTPASINM